MPTEIKAQNTTTLASVKAIYDAADQANTLLDGMQAAATAAGTTLEDIYQDAADAATAADNAQQAADTALVNLATTENVVGVLNWITAHGTMTSQSGGTFDPDQVYFVRDDSTPGDYHVGSHYYSIVSEPKAADINSYYVLTVDESVQNYVATHIVVDTEGLWIIPDAGGNKVLIATGSGSTYTTAGTYIVGTGNVVLASFTASGAVIGENASGKSRTEIGSAGMQIYRNVSGSDTQIANLGYGVGASGGGTTNNAPYYTFGERKTSAAPYDPSTTWSLGNMCKYNDELYVCIHEITTPEAWDADHWRYYIGNYSVAEGIQPIACGYVSHAEGVDVEAIGHNSHAEGSNTMAIGDLSHAEGLQVKAKGDYSHAEGAGTRANGHISHAEGCDTIANGEFSHAQNYNTKASSDSQTALGKYNVEDNADTYAVIIGNGTADNARSNALTVDWSGNVMAQGMAGMIQMFAGSTAPTGWLMCDGSAVSRTTYAKLFSVIGTTYGTGDGSTTFNLPDLRGRMPLGSSSSHLLASTGGSEYIQAHTHSNTIKAKTPKFTHSISSSNSNVNLLGGGLEQSYGKGGGSGSTYPYKRLSVADHAATDCTMSGSVGAVSGATTGNEGNMPPFLTINYIIATGNTA